MIHYALRCAAGHEFEGWFRSSAAFEQQSADRLLSCPECGGSDIQRGLMAPGLGRKGNTAAPPLAPKPATPAAPSQAATAAMPDAVRAMLQRLRAEVERTSEHVGTAFAREALAMHRGETEARAIHGDATEREREALADEGVEVQMIPWVERADG